MSKFRKHTVEEMRRRSKMRKQRKKYKRNSVKVISHSSSTDTPEEVSEGTVNFKRGEVSKGTANFKRQEVSEGTANFKREEVSEGTANFKRECVGKEEGSINYIEEDKSTVLSTAILINELGTIA